MTGITSSDSIRRDASHVDTKHMNRVLGEETDLKQVFSPKTCVMSLCRLSVPPGLGRPHTEASHATCCSTSWKNQV